MKGRPEEHMVTNLGDVPEGMTFLDATQAAVSLRKYEINPHHQSRRLTICETAREIWRQADSLPPLQRERMRLLAGAVYDYGKRLDRRLKELKGLL